jgi:hypothetical protein
MAEPESGRGRDVRLDFFRGLALLIIFVDHVPGSVLGQITPRYLGFSDAAEIFIFVSGYAAGLVYGQAMRTRGLAFAGVRILHRVWQLYIAHIFLFVLILTQISTSAAVFSNPMYWEEEHLALVFLGQPLTTMLQALLLRYQPSYTIILPMYVAILLMLIVLLPLLRASLAAAFVVSAGVYVAAGAFGLAPPSYPSDSRWFFNPFAWQFLFMIGVAFGLDPARSRRWVPRGRGWLCAALAMLASGLVVAASWRIPAIEAAMPPFVDEIVYGSDKTNLAPLQLLHFFALAYVAIRLLPRYERRLAGPIARPIVRCGQSALPIFCIGTLLAFFARVVGTQVPMGLVGRLALDVVGIAMLIAIAYGFAWWKSYQRRAEAGEQAATAAAPRA